MARRQIEEQEAARLAARQQPAGSRPQALHFQDRRPASASFDAVGAAAEAGVPEEQVRLYYMAVPPFLYASICGALRSGRRADAAAAAGAASAGDFAALSLAEGASDAGGAEGDKATAAANGCGVAAGIGNGGGNGGGRVVLPMPRLEERFVLEKPFGKDGAL